jgi:hypothetical protein
MPLPRRSDSAKIRLGPPSRDAGRLEEEYRLFVQLGAAVFLVEGEGKE